MKWITSAVLFVVLLRKSPALRIILEDVSTFVVNLKEFYEFNTFLIFQSEECLNDGNCWIDELLKMAIPVVILSHHPHHEQIREELSTSKTLTIVIVNSPSDPITKQATYALEGMRLSKTIFVLMFHNVRQKTIRAIFDWCWEHNMLNSAIVFYSKEGRVNVYTYSPFPRIRISNITHYKMKDIFPDKMKDLNGYKVRSPVKLDPPHVFKIATRNGEQIITGLAGRTLSEYVRSSNATFQEFPVPDTSRYIDMEKIFKLLQLKRIDISIHPHGHFNRSLSSASYPLVLTDFCFMVPVISEIPAFLYVVLAFDGSVWRLIAFEIIAVASALCFANFLVSGRISLGKAFCDSLKGTLYITIPGVKLQRKWQCTTISGLSLFGGFIITNIYLASLTSFFATTAYGNQIDTYDDLRRIGLRVMLTDLDKESLLRTGYFDKEFTSLLYPVDVDTLAKHRDHFNNSYAYLVSGGRWYYLRQQEQYKRHQSFRLSNMCFGDFFLSYPMQLDSPFMEPLRIFIMKSIQYGLQDIWIEQTFREAAKAGLVRIIWEPEQPVRIITFKHFTILWYLLGIGYFAGFVSFALEHLFHKIYLKILVEY